MAPDKYTAELISRTEDVIGDRLVEAKRWDRDLEKWAATVDRSQPASQREAAVRIEDAQMKRGAAMERLAELRRQGGDADDAWAEMREAVDLAWEEARKAYAAARDAVLGSSS